MTSGVYIMYYPTDDGQYYIGKSSNIENRFRDHCYSLLRKDHYNKAITSGYNKYGAPEIHILEILPCNDEILYSREVYWIEVYDSFLNGMNENPGA